MRGFCCWLESHGAKQNSTLFFNFFGRGHTSARLRFWHDVCPYDPTKVLVCKSIKRHFNVPKLTKVHD